MRHPAPCPRRAATLFLSAYAAGTGLFAAAMIQLATVLGG